MQRKAREETGLFLAEGSEFAARATAQGFVARSVLLSSAREPDAALQDLVDRARSGGAQVVMVPKALLSRIAGKDNPQDVLLVARQRWSTAVPGELREDDVVLALDRVRDPRNLGAILRTAEAAGLRMIVLVGSCCDPYSPEAVRASAGSLFAVPLMKLPTEGFVELAARWTGDVIGADVAAVTDFRHSRRGPVLLVMGNESEGLSREVSQACTRLVRIPMMPGTSSLNLAAAAALLVYELRLPALSPCPKQPLEPALFSRFSVS